VEEVRAAGDVTRAAGKRLHVLARDAADLRTALDAGADSLSPAMSLADEPALARRMADQGVVFVSSVSSWPRGPMASPERDERHRRSLGLILEAGVKVVPGIDLYGSDPVDELVALVQAGMTPMQALVAATSAGAELVQQSDQIGTVEPGKAADLVVVSFNPVEDLGALRDLQRIFLAGVEVRPDALREAIGQQTEVPVTA
jgi:imidazolonepropionase-like amidohydrolase